MVVMKLIIFLFVTEGLTTWMRGVTMTSSRALLMTVAQVSMITYLFTFFFTQS